MPPAGTQPELNPLIPAGSKLTKKLDYRDPEHKLGFMRRHHPQPYCAPVTARAKAHAVGRSASLRRCCNLAPDTRRSRSNRAIFGLRFYNPDTGRWLSRDPLQEIDALNLYACVGNDPLNFLDLLGLYTLRFDGSVNHTQRARAQQIVNAVKAKLPNFIQFIQQKYAEAAAYRPCCPYRKKWMSELSKLYSMMVLLKKEMDGSRDLTFKLKDIGVNFAQAMFVNDNPIYEVQLNKASSYEFFLESFSEQQGHIFHELTHLVGTEDAGVPRLWNAHYLDGVFTTNPFSFDSAEFEAALGTGWKRGCVPKPGTPVHPHPMP